MTQMTQPRTPHATPRFAFPSSSVGACATAHATTLADPDSPEVHEQLGELDDAMFAAIGGNAAALDKARSLWFHAVSGLPWESVEESRDQYLRYAVEVTRRAAAIGTRDHASAVAAREVMALLARR
jgi:hypothetical protein